MNQKVINIIFKIIMLILLMLLIKPNISYALSLSEIMQSGITFIQEGKAEGASIDGSKLKETSNSIYYILLGIGVILSVLVGALLGIKIMWGSIEEQTKAKEALMPYVMGCVIIFGAFAIWKLAVTVFSEI